MYTFGIKVNMQKIEIHKRYSPINNKKKYIIHACVLFLFTIFILFIAVGRMQLATDNKLSVWFFDVGQGDASFIKTPDNHKILIDGGPDGTVMDKLSSVMWPWDNTIDIIIITHMDADHVNGLTKVFDKYKINTVIYNNVTVKSPISKYIQQKIVNEKSKIINVESDYTYNIGDVKINILWPKKHTPGESIKDKNNNSIVFGLQYKNTDVLFTGDIEKETEKNILPYIKDVDVLKVAHHGSKTSSTSDFLEKSKPEYSVISAGENNRYNHPNYGVLERLKDIGSHIYRTDFDSDIMMIIDSYGYTIKSNPLPF